MQPLLLGLLFGLLGVTGVLLGVLLVLSLMRLRATVLPVLLAFAAGTLLGAAFLGLIPESAEGLDLRSVTGLALLAVVAFFLLEKWVLWRHSHLMEGSSRGAAGYLILVGDGIHNIVDGLALGAAFVADPWLGVTVGIAVLAHEIPQEVGDFVLLLESGLSKARALAYNLLSAAAIFPGVIAGYLLVEAVAPAISVALALAAGGFLYVALADLVPDLHHRGRLETLHFQLPPMLAGIALIWLVGTLEA